jgi:2'-hydroxyisoflavone reductase
MNRRDVLKLGALAGAASILGRSALAGAQGQPARADSTQAAAASGPLRILILGGTGFTGPHQVRYALARGHKLTLFNRGRRPQDWPGEVEELTGDREKGDVQALAGREWDVCIDNPTSVPHWVRDVGQVLKGRVKQYVFISSLSAYAHTRNAGMDESTPTAEYSGKDVMAETRASLIANMSLFGPLKAACEREAEEWFPGRTTIIRPTLIVGPGDETDRFTYWPVRIAKGGEVLAPPGDDPVQLIDARDLAEWTIRVVEQQRFGAFNAVGPDFELSTAAMLHGIRAAVGGNAKFVFTTADFLREQNVRAWSDFPVWVPGSDPEYAGFHRTSNARALAAGLTYRPLATTAADTLAWFNSRPEDRRAKLRAGLAPERETGILNAWKARI